MTEIMLLQKSLQYFWDLKCLGSHSLKVVVRTHQGCCFRTSGGLGTVTSTASSPGC